MADAITASGAISADGKTMTLETGALANLANGAVVVNVGKTTVLVTATANKNPRPGTDFFPLTVDFEERSYAAGKIPGSFFRREGRASESAILACRLTDRPLRPLFPDGFRNDVHRGRRTHGRTGVLEAVTRVAARARAAPPRPFARAHSRAAAPRPPSSALPPTALAALLAHLVFQRL